MCETGAELAGVVGGVFRRVREARELGESHDRGVEARQGECRRRVVVAAFGCEWKGSRKNRDEARRSPYPSVIVEVRSTPSTDSGARGAGEEDAAARAEVATRDAMEVRGREATSEDVRRRCCSGAARRRGRRRIPFTTRWERYARRGRARRSPAPDAGL